MAILLPILIVALVLVTLSKSGPKRKLDLGFLIMILVAALLLSSAHY
jgi:hypothetical protein